METIACHLSVVNLSSSITSPFHYTLLCVTLQFIVKTGPQHQLPFSLFLHLCSSLFLSPSLCLSLSQSLSMPLSVSLFLIPSLSLSLSQSLSLSLSSYSSEECKDNMTRRETL